MDTYTTLSPLCLSLIVRLDIYIVNLCVFYSYSLIGKLTTLFQFQHFRFRNLPVVSSTTVIFTVYHFVFPDVGKRNLSVLHGNNSVLQGKIPDYIGRKGNLNLSQGNIFMSDFPCYREIMTLVPDTFFSDGIPWWSSGLICSLKISRPDITKESKLIIFRTPQVVLWSGVLPSRWVCKKDKRRNLMIVDSWLMSKFGPDCVF